jgi:hypothetical protein
MAVRCWTSFRLARRLCERGIGGDSSVLSSEGAVVAGISLDSTDALIAADIKGAGYGA